MHPSCTVTKFHQGSRHAWGKFMGVSLYGAGEEDLASFSMSHSIVS